MRSTHKIRNYMYNLRKTHGALHFKWDGGKQNQSKLSKALEGRKIKRVEMVLFHNEKAEGGLNSCFQIS